MQTRNVCCPLAPVSPLSNIHFFSVGDYYRGCGVCRVVLVPLSLDAQQARPFSLAFSRAILHRGDFGLWFQGLQNESLPYPQVSKLWMFAGMSTTLYSLWCFSIPVILGGFRRKTSPKYIPDCISTMCTRNPIKGFSNMFCIVLPVLRVLPSCCHHTDELFCYRDYSILLL